MTTRTLIVPAIMALVCTALLLCNDRTTFADEAKAPATDDAGKVLLEYRFEPGEVIRWQVEHRANIRSTVAGTTQTAETISRSVKAWRVEEASDHSITFVHMVESVDMRQKLTGRQEVRYNSQTDAEVPVGFQDAAKNVGVPLTVVTMDPRGVVLKRDEKSERAASQLSQITVQLPAEAIEVGHVWKVPFDVQASSRDGRVAQIKAQQRMELESVENGIATIRFATQILTPIHDPVIEAQVIQGQSEGKIRFDIARGRIIEQQSDLDKRVHGFQGEASTLHYITRFTEELLTEAEAEVATRAVIGPAPPPKSTAHEPAARLATKPDAADAE